jgi:hypothetical protein
MAIFAEAEVGRQRFRFASKRSAPLVPPKKKAVEDSDAVQPKAGTAETKEESHRRRHGSVDNRQGSPGRLAFDKREGTKACLSRLSGFVARESAFTTRQGDFVAVLALF